MLCNFFQKISRMTRRGVVPASLALASLLVFGSLEASASTVYFTGTGNNGTTVTEANNSGVTVIDLSATLPSRLVGYLPTHAFDGVSTQNCSQAADIDLYCRSLKITLDPFSLPASQNTGSASNPLVANTTWTIKNVSGRYLSAVVLNLISSPGAAGLNPALVGIDLNSSDGHVIIQTQGLYLPAIEYDFSLGPLAPGDSFQAVVNYRVKDLLEPIGDGNYLLPTLLTNAIVVPVPEPGTLSLFALGLVSIAAFRRRR